MLKNLFIYSFKYVAVVLALVAFSACNRTEFTEDDAYDLENRRAWEQQKRDSVAALNELNNIKDLETFRAALDQMMRDNAGGKVFYAVTVVPGGSSAFTNGRLEDVQGVAGVTVTATQFGGAMVQTVTTDESGIAVFELYSGEVAVHIDAPDHTNVSYVSNLTPNGGVANGAIAYVGNVVPVFDDPNSPNAAIEDIANVSGKAVAEIDLTNSIEENVPSGTPITAHIDVDAGGFWDKYIIDNNSVYLDNNGINGGDQTNRSGQIQRIAYEEASQRSTVNGSGDYSMLVAATASGLPIKVLASDFAADRIWYAFDPIFDGSTDDDEQTDNFGLATSTRFLYTMNTANDTQSGDIQTGANDLADFSFWRASFVDEPAVVNVAYINGDRLLTERIGGSDFLVVNPGGATAEDRVSFQAADAAGVAGLNPGYYLADVTDAANATATDVLPPMVTFSAPTAGTQATGQVVLTAADANDRGREVFRIRVTNPGAGYTAAPSVSFMRNTTGVTGFGTIQTPATAIRTNVRIIDGGYGFIDPIAAFPSQETGRWTGLDPVINIPQITGLTLSVVADFEYDWENSSGDDIGTVQEIEVTSSSSNWTVAALTALNNSPFRYSQQDASADSDTDGDELFVINNGQLEFNPAHAGFVTANTLDLTVNNGTATGSGYVFVPVVTYTQGTSIPAANQTQRAASFVAEVDATGQVISVRIVDAGAYDAALNGTLFDGGLSIFVPNDQTSLDAEFGLGGSSVDNYVINGTGVGSFIQDKLSDPNANTDLDAEDNSYVVWFAEPTAAGGQRAYGYPVFSGSTVIGIEIYEAGADYATAQANNIPFTIEEIFATDSDNNAAVRAALTPAILRFTIANGGLGYAVRPQIYVYGGNKSAEDLDELNTTIRDAFDAIPTNSRGSFPTTGPLSTFDVTIPNNPFLPTEPLITPADIAVEAIGVATGVGAIQNAFNARLQATHAFLGGIPLGTQFEYFLNGNGADGHSGGMSGAFGGFVGFSNYFEGIRQSTNTGLGYSAIDEYLGYNENNVDNELFLSFRLSAINVLIGDTGFAGRAIVDPYNAERVIGVSVTDQGSGLFVLPLNHPSIPADGEPFRFIGGPAGGNFGLFETYSGMNYIRDIHYGTGVELD
ncbi:hypothetical protein [Hugenholtzia roseola]|uniref:hypothetical protein n=1 Tax=Hugenholtzia roseola TaxID=1002 RepID=UPI0004176051|nr:hypothetical protein [Hugenholtzia roseola]